MIDVIKRPLNPRYYRSAIRPEVEVKFHVRFSSPIKIDYSIQNWEKRLEEAAHAFGQLSCQGTIKAFVKVPSGYTTDGKLDVFDEQTKMDIGPKIVELFGAISGYGLCTKPFAAHITIEVRVLSIFFERGSVLVPFKELDTEPHEEPAHMQVVPVPSPLLN
jgi:hypothetical protein